MSHYFLARQGSRKNTHTKTRSEQNKMTINQTLLYLPIFLLFIFTTSTTTNAQPFSCKASSNCTAMIDYVSPNDTTILKITALFGISKNLYSFLGANNLPPTTRSSRPIKAKQTIKIPFPCRCVPNGSYVLTAGNCVQCMCDAANNYTLQCQQSEMKSTIWPSCPNTRCNSVFLGNGTTSGCNRTTCAYQGYDNQKILANLTTVSTSTTNSHIGTGAIAGGVVGVVLLFAGSFIVLAWWSKKKRMSERLKESVLKTEVSDVSWKSPVPHVNQLRRDQFFNLPAEEDTKVHLGQLKRFPLRELQVATDNFSKKKILGRGGFGKVYQGRLDDGTLVAVKRLKEERTQGGELQFQTEIEMISMAVHRNLLQLRGFCMTPTERLLVYPYMSNGSVASCLREKSESQPPLDWTVRQRIALGTARGLAYLHGHCNPKIIHRDVKAANILLDEEFEAVVGDFGLAKLMDNTDTHVTTAVRGTIGHIAPEYLSTGKSSEKTDCFGYGIMLLELITGRRAFDLARLANDDDVMLLDWVKGLLINKKLQSLVDANMQGNFEAEQVEELLQIALLCTQDSPAERPKMSEVVKMLEGDGLAEKWEKWQEEMFRQESNNTHNPFTHWTIADSTYNLRADELSAPR